ncbi:hypothetical protein R3P38DRAFT_2889279 [Favolaschia claudopus]|uniref:Transmembrane protein n=1 Tax=Favolaschia claudopus TaxID=2862362 RepID=A0AAW0CSR0_9AGAR
MSAPRRVVVDDTDPTIRYGPSGWFAADPQKLNSLGNYGPIYNGTSHGTTTTNSSLDFPFNGTSISILGTIAISTDSNNNTDPTWDCFVDKIKISNPSPTFKFPENNWQLCDQEQISPGEHVLTIQVQSKGQAFYLDQIIYTPLPSASYDSAVLQYKNNDPAVSYGSGWRPWGAQNVTQTSGAQVALNFHGTSVTLFGYVPTELPHNASSGSYTIDNGPPVPFTLNGLAAQSATAYNTVMFKTNTLTDTTHNLVVTYEGDNSQTPLAVGTFYVTSTAAKSSTSSSSSSPLTPSDSSRSGTTTTKSSPVGAIVGGIIGFLAALAIIVGLIFWCRRRQRQQTETAQQTTANPFMMSSAEPGPASAQYSYSAVPPEPSGSPYIHSDPRSYPAPQSSTTTYPYIPPGASVPTDSSRSHAHSHSTSSANFSSASELSPQRAHANTDAAHAASLGYPSPVTSKASARSRVLPAPPPLAGSTSRQDTSQTVAPIMERHLDSGVRLDPDRPLTPVSLRDTMELPPYTRN